MFLNFPSHGILSGAKLLNFCDLTKLSGYYLLQMSINLQYLQVFSSGFCLNEVLGSNKSLIISPNFAINSLLSVPFKS